MKSKFEYIIDRDDDNKITGRSIQITITDKTITPKIIKIHKSIAIIF